MASTTDDNSPRAYWFVGASWGDEDQTRSFLNEGIWENGYDDRYRDLVCEMRPGERIAIKATYTRKHGLPFDSRGRDVSVMQIKATGTITENPKSGKRVRVDWKEQPRREWYFHTYQHTVWRVEPGDWRKDNLIAFAFEGKPQDIDRFLTEAADDTVPGDLDGPENGGRGPEAVRDDQPYSVDEILKDGCFLRRDNVEHLLELLRDKKNLILQGPPGTGKTWLAKRLAFAMMQKKDVGRVRRVQFHPNLSYEDFVRGWRPAGEGKLVIEDGAFMQAVRQATDAPSSTFTVVIEEINRGNPAQIFGELLTLIEADKRTPEAAVELCYPDENGYRRPVHIPENLYVIGTMNTADRSLALMDLAFRRRFAFATLDPMLGDVWRKWVTEKCGVDGRLALEIGRRCEQLNQNIATDDRLGAQFRVGHSFVTPLRRLEANETRSWFRRVVESEIGPHLEEYWFDEPRKAQEAIKRLLDGW